MSKLKEELEFFIMEKTATNPSEKFILESLQAGKENLNYNTKPENETGNINTILPSLSKKDAERMEIIKGELLIKTQNKNEVKWAQEIGLKVNPYQISEDGELESSDGNLLLVDSTGKLVIPEGVVSIGEGAFANLEGLKTIIIPGTVKKIERNAFTNNVTLEKVIMEDGVEYIGQFAFMNCTNLLEVEMPNSVTYLGVQAFYNDTNLNKIKLSNKLGKIENYTFAVCQKLESIEIPEGITALGSCVFEECINLKSIKISKTVKTIETTSFSITPNLKNIEIDPLNTNLAFEQGVLLGNNKEEIIKVLENEISGNTFIVPKSVTKLGARILETCPQIQRVEIPKNVKTIDPLFFAKSITEVVIDENNKIFTCDGKAVYQDKINLLIYYAKDSTVTIEDGIENILDFAFYANKNMQNIILPNSIKTIGNQVFNGCTNLKKIELGENIEQVNPLFIYGSGIEEIVINEKNSKYTVNKNLLLEENGTKLITVIAPMGSIETLEIPKGIIEIGDFAVHNQNKMTSITIPNTVIKIGKSFNYSRGLTSINIPSSVEFIGNTCFAESNNLKEIKIDKKKGTIEGSPWGCIYGERAIIWKE